MADLNGFVREFKSRLAGVSRDDYLEKWGLRWVLGAVVSKFPLDEISLYLEDVFGHTETEAFYAGFQPQLSQARGHILGVLASASTPSASKQLPAASRLTNPRCLRN